MNHLTKPLPVPPAVGTKPPYMGAKIEIKILPQHLKGASLLQQAKLLASMLGYPVEQARQEVEDEDGKCTILSFGRSTAYAEMVMKVPTSILK